MLAADPLSRTAAIQALHAYPDLKNVGGPWKPLEVPEVFWEVIRDHDVFLDYEDLEFLASYAYEFMVHGVDVDVFLDLLSSESQKLSDVFKAVFLSMYPDISFCFIVGLESMKTCSIARQILTCEFSSVLIPRNILQPSHYSLHPFSNSNITGESLFTNSALHL
ncbi:hypothetical protein ACFE04_020361 [Oxalis oulophora]